MDVALTPEDCAIKELLNTLVALVQGTERWQGSQNTQALVVICQILGGLMLVSSARPGTRSVPGHAQLQNCARSVSGSFWSGAHRAAGRRLRRVILGLGLVLLAQEQGCGQKDNRGAQPEVPIRIKAKHSRTKQNVKNQLDMVKRLQECRICKAIGPRQKVLS